ncbi:hypothetical protein BDZ89DRAFT_1141054 [Hymenopellis radicata]|nr:hypothetical protein BDZ89DRAFT_1141054 [Hymenopellis radicata]
MVNTSSSSQKSPPLGRRVDTVELLHLAQLFLDIRLDPHQASILSDLVAAATDPQVDTDANALSATSSGPSSAPAPSSAFGPPAYATQPATAAATGSISSPGPAAAAVNTGPAAVNTAAAVNTSPAVTSTNPATVVPASVVPATVVPAAAATGIPSPPATNQGFPHYQVLPNTFPYERPAYGTPGPYYAITRGRVVGVVAGWDKASPLCIGVGGAVFRSVPSIDIGRSVVEAALNAGSCMLLP